ncbi:phenylalanine--tRNA ligase, alpha subunit [Orientia chuto str. Dubai]|uniref:Phenylalanine--tRNA ligase alpha subunit n=1 Tax=Orientia chuto str. Dubai TaxID=1359168 RepID=A0A0F3MPC2_9RICK|nr:phenylalanine--tRNA ligase subunit alpha [Candidatus Orientia mediorientalis]KJV57521.1 phenylalanine--tRNA ligase, alpha subunit [Orientia chuto str. Dubai]
MLNQILSKFREEISNINEKKALNNLKLRYLGKSGIITLQFKNIAELDIEHRRDYKSKVSLVKTEIETLISTKLAEIQKQEMIKLLDSEKIDVTLPSRKKFHGSIHPISQVTEELLSIFSMFNLKVFDGPNIESDWYNFSALNIGSNHAARQMHDTFYLNNSATSNQMLLRTHTSNVSIRIMEQQKPPIYLVAPGRVYRSDFDATHTPMFHQIDGIIVDKNIHMGHLKYIIINFIKMFFEKKDIEIIFRPSFFPFTEPSAEVDIKCSINNKWLEVLGCGMIHPNVLRNVNIDPDEYQAIAFGLGIERFAMLKYGITDLRKFFENDQRWLQYYSFSAFDIHTMLYGLSR